VFLLHEARAQGYESLISDEDRAQECDSSLMANGRSDGAVPAGRPSFSAIVYWRCDVEYPDPAQVIARS